MELMALELLLKPRCYRDERCAFSERQASSLKMILLDDLEFTRRAVIEREKKATPGLKADQELGLRVVLAGGFKARLDRNGTHPAIRRLRRGAGNQDKAGKDNAHQGYSQEELAVHRTKRSSRVSGRVS